MNWASNNKVAVLEKFFDDCIHQQNEIFLLFLPLKASYLLPLELLSFPD